jgi:lipopolysaccharide transport system ATP-binding protein
LNHNTIIKVENLSKYYLLNKIKENNADTLAGSILVGLKKISNLDFKKEQEEFRAIDNISFEIEKGDRVGIIGRNGAGKSTLLKILSRITPPTKGRIEINGRMASLLEVGTGFHGDLSGRENIYLNGSILGMKKQEIDKKFDEIIDFAEIEKFLDTPVKRYSSGMYVRLAFAVAAHLEPEILIVDEVLAVGDAAFQKKCLGKMNDVSKKEGRTILFVSHQMGAVQALCNKGIVLSKGTKVFDGLAQESVNYYLRLNSDVSELSLLERKDRIGNLDFQFTDISFKNKNAEIVREVMSSEFLEIELKYIAKPKFDFENLIISVAFVDDYNNIVLAFVSDEMGQVFIDTHSKKYNLKIPQLMLRGHNYNIRLFASCKGTSESSVCDLIESAASLQVLSYDFWHTGKLAREGAYAINNGTYIV